MRLSLGVIYQLPQLLAHSNYFVSYVPPFNRLQVAHGSGNEAEALSQLPRRICRGSCDRRVVFWLAQADGIGNCGNW